MYTNVYTTERNANAQYVAELNRAQHTQLVRQAQAQQRQDHLVHDNTSNARRFERVMAHVKSILAGGRGISSTPAR